MSEQARKSLSISFRVDSGVIEHNNRKIIAKNVDRARICDNIIYRQQDIKQKYAELFGQALSEYNAKQTQKSRRISDYYEHVLKSAKCKPFYEVVVQFGDVESYGFIPIGYMLIACYGKLGFTASIFPLHPQVFVSR